MYPHLIRLRGPWEYATGEGHAITKGTMTVPGFWHDQQVFPHGAVTLSRWFNWVGRVSPEETLWLCLDRCVGRVTANLNGARLGTHENPWDAFRFEVSHLIEPRNRLVLDIEPLRESHWSAALGVLNRARSREEHAAYPVGGILGGVHLLVESRILEIQDVGLDVRWKEGKGAVRLGGALETCMPTIPKGMARLLLDGIEITSKPLPASAASLELDVGELDVQPWWPRSLGIPFLHELVLQVETTEGVTHERMWRIGFRSLAGDPESGYSCNGQPLPMIREALRADRSFSPYFGEDPSAPFGDWSMAKSTILHVIGHFPPESLYDVCDRAGLLIEQDLPPGEACQAGEDRQLFQEWDHAAMKGRLAWHPSFAGVRPFVNDSSRVGP